MKTLACIDASCARVIASEYSVYVHSSVDVKRSLRFDLELVSNFYHNRDYIDTLDSIESGCLTGEPSSFHNGRGGQCLYLMKHGEDMYEIGMIDKPSTHLLIDTETLDAIVEACRTTLDGKQRNHNKNYWCLQGWMENCAFSIDKSRLLLAPGNVLDASYVIKREHSGQWLRLISELEQLAEFEQGGWKRVDASALYVYWGDNDKLMARIFPELGQETVVPLRASVQKMLTIQFLIESFWIQTESTANLFIALSDDDDDDDDDRALS